MSIAAGLVTVYVGEYLLNNSWVFWLLFGLFIALTIKVSDSEYKKDEQRERLAAWERLKAMSSPEQLQHMKNDGFYDDMENEMKEWRESNG
jgi:hypothetical protein